MQFGHILAPAVEKRGDAMRINELISNQETYRADGTQTVLEVVCAMVARNIGAVPVLQGGMLVGIFSERDLMKRVVAEGLDPQVTRVDEVMTEDPLTVSPTESAENCMVLMRRHGFRHLPICEGKQLVAMISLRDLLLHDLTEKDHEVQMMRAYIHQASPEL
jgi:CBS domain-containing protein